ncbi:MAG: S8 family serine peptidase [Actinophytocola sp.]|uniref:S8 family peptidase n=1 Tax=Actinophytocola sp. TaxID=1872138 RepID=UPI00132AC974|nr:S8 family serine peptidase [Actinophytocola sp.]MPZ82390.1 S8 family serine peptidase [Actinophytocola sp.]
MRPGIGLVLVVTVAVTAAGLSSGQPAAADRQGPVAHFVVLGPEDGPLAKTEESVRDAGGQILRSWPQIGVVVATSERADFAAAVRLLPGVEAAGATRNLVELTEGARPRGLDDRAPLSRKDGVAATTGSPEPLAANQWGMRQIGADRANDISGGSRDQLVGVLDAGVDAGHPDLASNIDAANSVSCGDEGVPDTSPEAWAPPPDFSHGTAVAGIIAADRNGVGIAGVAPNVRIASVRIADDDLWIYPEYAICGYVWAAEHGIQVTSASIFVDPWLRWCDDDPDQAAGAEAMRRAIDYATGHGVVNVAAIGNLNWDMSHPVLDTISPDNGEPVERLTGDNCALVPGEAPGVVAVSATGAAARKTFYSSYGIRDTDVTAPGGDELQIPDTPDRDPGILTTMNNGAWGYFGGTSAATPHVAGVVALIRGTHPDWSPQQVVAALRRDADPLPCPPGGWFDPDGTGDWLAYCQGGRSGRGFYGSGLVDALDAVTR